MTMNDWFKPNFRTLPGFVSPNLQSPYLSFPNFLLLFVMPVNTTDQFSCFCVTFSSWHCRTKFTFPFSFFSFTVDTHIKILHARCFCGFFRKNDLWVSVFICLREGIRSGNHRQCISSSICRISTPSGEAIVCSLSFSSAQIVTIKFRLVWRWDPWAVTWAFLSPCPWTPLLFQVPWPLSHIFLPALGFWLQALCTWSWFPQWLGCISHTIIFSPVWIGSIFMLSISCMITKAC